MPARIFIKKPEAKTAPKTSPKKPSYLHFPLYASGLPVRKGVKKA